MGDHPIRAVHPHVRGDSESRPYMVLVQEGSPPRAWGQHTRRSRGPASRPVHPHVRGDSSSRTTASVTASGSPPRAWGQLAGVVGDDDIHGFTPTCVGTASGSYGRTTTTKVHPHVRGDSVQPTSANCAAAGSPPRAWGQLPVELRPDPVGGFTPTCVGTAHSGQRFRHRHGVHPHVRGDSIWS